MSFEGAASDFSEPINLSFEETDLLKTWLWSPNHMSWSENVIEFRANDAKNARSGNNYIQFNSVPFHYNIRYLMLYDPNSQNNILYLDPNSTYLISYWYYTNDNFASVNFDLRFNDPSGITSNSVIADRYNIPVDDVAVGKWQKVDHVVKTGDKCVSVAISSNQAPFECAIDDISIQKIKEVVIKFNSNGGTEIESLTALTGFVIPEDDRPFDPFKDGYIFDGWYKDTSLTQHFDFKTMVVSGDMTLYAKWQAEDSVSSMTNDLDDGDHDNRDNDDNDDNVLGGNYDNSLIEDNDHNEIDTGNRPNMLDADGYRTVNSPDEITIIDNNAFPWMIVLFSTAGAAVTVGAGAAAYIFLIKKKRIKLNIGNMFKGGK